MCVTGPQKGQKCQSRQGRIGFPVGAFAKTFLPGRTVRGEVVVVLDGRPVVIPRDAGVPSAVVILVTTEPVERALDRQLAGGTGADPLCPHGAVGFEPRLIHPRYLRRILSRHAIAQRGQPGPASMGRARIRCHSSQRNRFADIRYSAAAARVLSSRGPFSAAATALDRPLGVLRSLCVGFASTVNRTPPGFGPV